MFKRLLIGFLCGLPLTGLAKERWAIDFSHAGYGGGGVRKPDVGQVIYLTPTGGDDTALFTEALAQLAQRPIQADGYRGAIVFSADTFRFSETLRIGADGIVLRGTESEGRISTLLATGTEQRVLLEVGCEVRELADSVRIVADVALGAMAVAVESVTGFSVGDRVALKRPSTAEWIASVGMDGVWESGRCGLLWDRQIVKVDKSRNLIYLDAPLTMAMEGKFGGGWVVKTSSPMRGFVMERLVLDSEFDISQQFYFDRTRQYYHDEKHAWEAVRTNYLEDAYFDGVKACHFVYSGFHIGRRTRRVTLRNCEYQSPVSAVEEHRRINYLIEGQQVLAYCCLSERGMCDFAAGDCASGPNVFLTCMAAEANGASGGYGAWANGFLYEDVHIQNSTFFFGCDDFRLNVGWNMANSVLWNCSSDYMDVKDAPDAPNLVGNSPKSIYLNQLSERKGDAALKILTE